MREQLSMDLGDSENRPTRILFCGGREFSDRAAISAAFDEVQPRFVITGAAPGADRLADEEAERRGIPRVLYPANWIGERRSAGPIRNVRMLLEGRPDLVVAFPGDVGTPDMVRQAERAGVPVLRWGWG